MKRFLAISVSFAVCTASAFAAEFTDNLIQPGHLVIAAAPYGSGTMVDANGKVSGFDVDLGDQLGKDLGLEVDHEVLDWSGVLPGLIGGRYDMALSSITKSEKRLSAGEFLMSKNYAVDGLGVVARADDASIDSWDSICGKRIAFVSGAIEESIAQKNLPENCVANASYYPGPPEALLDLKNNRVDAFVTGFVVGGWVSENDPAYKLLPDVIAPYAMAAAISKSNPELAAKVDELIEKYIADGTLKAIFAKYGVTPDWDKVASVPPAQ